MLGILSLLVERRRCPRVLALTAAAAVDGTLARATWTGRGEEGGCETNIEDGLLHRRAWFLPVSAFCLTVTARRWRRFAAFSSLRRAPRTRCHVASPHSAPHRWLLPTLRDSSCRMLRAAAASGENSRSLLPATRHALGLHGGHGAQSSSSPSCHLTASSCLTLCPVCLPADVLATPLTCPRNILSDLCNLLFDGGRLSSCRSTVSYYLQVDHDMGIRHSCGSGATSSSPTVDWSLVNIMVLR